MINRLLKNSYLFLVFAFFYIPILILVIFSFNQSEYSLLWHGFTFNWYHELFSDSDLWVATYHSLLLSVLSASLATFLGLIAATCLHRYEFFGKRLLHGFTFILILSPEIVMGAAFLILFTGVGISLGFFSLLLSHTTFCLPFVIVTLLSRMSHFDENLFEAAKDLGASDFMILRRIIFPLLAPALLSGWLLSFSLSLDDVIISYFVAGPEFDILPLRIYAMVRSGVKPEINALCTVLFSLTLLIAILSQRLLKKDRA